MRFRNSILSLSMVIAAPALICFGTHSAYAQTSYGNIAGSVTDSSGAAVVDADVTVTSLGTGETHSVKTNKSGGYNIQSVGTGIYSVTFAAPNFSKTVVDKVTVEASVSTSVNGVLQVGTAQDTVEVSASRELLKTESGEYSEIVNSKEISDLPVNSLNAYALATTLPGVTTVTTVGLTNGTSFSAAGSRPRQNNFLIEGQDNNDAGIAGQGLQPENQEALESVTFFVNSAQAEFGRGGGVVSNLVYKSGTDTFHGAAFNRFLNADLNTFNHSTTYNGGQKTNFRENIFGYRIGGPIVHNKLFFFVSQQFDHYRASAVLSTLTVPTAAGYAVLNNLKGNAQVAKLITNYGGLIGADPAGSGTASAGKYPANSKVIALGADPVTGLDRGSVQFGGVARVIGAPTNSNEFVTKVDYQITSKDKLQARFVRSPFSEPYDTGNFPSQLPLFDTQQVGISYNAGLVENHIFTPNIFNELRLSYGRIGFTFDLRPDTYSNPNALAPTVTISGITGFGIPTNTPQGRFHNTYQLQDALSVTHGAHSMKFGFDIAQVRVRDAIPFVFYGSQSYINSNAAGATPAYSSLANYVDDYSGNTGANTSSLTKTFGSNIARPTLTNQAYYAEDHWKISSKLTAEMGLRYEYYGAPFNYLAYPAIDPANLGCFITTTTQNCRVTVKPNYRNFAPRLNFAYSPGNSQKIVVRGGFGMFYDSTFTNVADNLQASAPNAASPVLYNSSASARGTGAWSTQFTSLSSTPLATNSVTSVVPNFKNPITYQYNTQVQVPLPYAMSLTAGYIGARFEHLYGLDYLNPTIPGTSTRAIAATRGAIAVHDNSGDGNYNGAIVELRRSYRGGSDVRLSYTYGKAMDDVSEEYTSGNYSAYPEQQYALGGVRGRDYGPSAFDHKQRAVLSTVYGIPAIHASSFAGKSLAYAVNGFQLSTIISFQTGSVINVLDGLDINGDGVNNDRPVLENINAPRGSFAVRGTDYYSAATGGVPGVYCDGQYYYNGLTKNPTTDANDNFCHPVSLSQVQYYVGNRYQQNASISRNASYTPGVFSGDAALQRMFKIGERMDFLFRGECYNFLNHANTGIPNATLASSGNQPNAAGYSLNTFENYAPTTSGTRTIRIFLKYEF